MADATDGLVAQGIAPREARWLREEFGDDPKALAFAVRRRRGGEPLQYVVGHWPFRSLDLLVDERVLIPRPETEGVVDVALAELAAGGVTAPMVLDLGCGSGAIGLAVVLELADRGVAAALVAVDRSGDALAVARENARRHGLTKVTFIESDWYGSLDTALEGRFDLIVANPPYVAASELATLDPVLEYEPRVALVADDTDRGPGLAAIEAVVLGAPRWLAADGRLVVEHGSTQGAAARAVAHEAGLRDVRTVPDLAGLDRVLVARR